MSRHLLENFFGYRKTILMLVVIITFVLGFGLTKLKFDVSLGYEKDSVSVSSLEKAFQQRERGGAKSVAPTMTVILHDKNLFTLDKLGAVKQLLLNLLDDQYIAGVDSLYNMPDLEYYFKSEQWLPVITGNEKTPQDLAYVKRQATNNKLFISRFVNADETTLSFYITFKPISKKESYLARDSVQEILNKYQDNFEKAYQVGELETDYYSYHAIIFNLKTVGILSLLALMLVYGLLFKRVIMGILPFASSGLGLVWAGGITGYAGIPINSLVCVIMVLVFTIGAMECAHFINAYQKFYKKYPDTTKAKLAAKTTQHVFWPIFLATGTTVIGFFFNIFTDVKLLEDFAVTICLAIFINGVIICTVLPLFLHFSIKSADKEGTRDSEKNYFNNLISFAFYIHRKVIARPRMFFALLLIITAFGGFFMAKLPIEVVPYINFYKNSTLMQKVFDTQKYLSGTRTISIYFDAKKSGAFIKKEYLDKLFNIEQAVQKLPETSSTLSMATVIATVNNILMGEDGDVGSDAGSMVDNYRVPNAWYFNNDVVKQAELVPALSSTVANDYSAAKISINYQVYNTNQLTQYINEIKNIIENNLAGSDITYQFSGNISKSMVSTLKVMKAQIMSIAIIFLLILLVMWAVFKKFKAGIIAIVPNVFPLAGVFILMYLLNIPFFPITIIVLAAIVGLAVDDTIHIMLAFKKYYQQSHQVDLAIKNALASQMRPVTIASISLVFGFGMMTFSSVKSVMLFSVLICFGAFLSWISDMVVTPFLLKKFNICK